MDVRRKRWDVPDKVAKVLMDVKLLDDVICVVKVMPDKSTG